MQAKCNACRCEFEATIKKGFTSPNGTMWSKNEDCPYEPSKLVPVEVIDCPRCGRRYKKREDGVWFSDRPLEVLATKHAKGWEKTDSVKGIFPNFDSM